MRKASQGRWLQMVSSRGRTLPEVKVPRRKFSSCWYTLNHGGTPVWERWLEFVEDRMGEAGGAEELSPWHKEKEGRWELKVLSTETLVFRAENPDGLLIS